MPGKHCNLCAGGARSFIRLQVLFSFTFVVEKYDNFSYFRLERSGFLDPAVLGVCV